MTIFQYMLLGTGLVVVALIGTIILIIKSVKSYKPEDSNPSDEKIYIEDFNDKEPQSRSRLY